MFEENCLPISTNAAHLLLQRLEEVSMMTAQGSGEDYLAIFARVLGMKDIGDACKQLDALRLALARYYARCTLASSSALFKNDLRTS
jgi:nuclear pore complex protein Nup85